MSLTLSAETAGTSASKAFHAVRLETLDHPFVRRIAREAATAFASPAYLAALCETLGEAAGAEPVVVAVSDDAGRPVALFPFTLRRNGGLTTVEGLGLGVTDYYAPILAANVELDAGETRRLWRAVVTALPRADLLRLINVPRTLYGRTHALTHAAFLGDMGHAATVMPLAPAGEPLDLGAFSVSRDVRRKLKKLGAIGEVRFAVATDPAGCSALMDALVAFRRDRFAKMGRRDRLDDPGVAAFYRRLAAEGSARLYGLRVGGEIVAVVYGLAQDGVFTLLIPTMSADPRFEPGSPGLVSLYLSIEAAIAGGDEVFDFSVGDLFYKSRFSTEKVELFEHIEALSRSGIPAMLGIRARTAARLFRQRHAGKVEQLKALLRRPS